MLFLSCKHLETDLFPMYQSRICLKPDHILAIAFDSMQTFFVIFYPVRKKLPGYTECHVGSEICMI